MLNLLNPFSGPLGSMLVNPQARQAGVEAYGGARALMREPDFKRMFQFGLIDNGVLVVMMLAGLSLDDWIAKKVGVKGYGAVMGAVIGNAVSDGVAAIPQGPASAFGVTAGALVPAVPLVVAMGAKKPLTGMTHKAVLASSVGLLAWTFMKKKNGGMA